MVHSFNKTYNEDIILDLDCCRDKKKKECHPQNPTSLRIKLGDETIKVKKYGSELPMGLTSTS